jgi:hypothetical protein
MDIDEQHGEELAEHVPAAASRATTVGTELHIPVPVTKDRFDELPICAALLGTFPVAQDGRVRLNVFTAKPVEKEYARVDAERGLEPADAATLEALSAFNAEYRRNERAALAALNASHERQRRQEQKQAIRAALPALVPARSHATAREPGRAPTSRKTVASSSRGSPERPSSSGDDPPLAAVSHSSGGAR